MLKVIQQYIAEDFETLRVFICDQINQQTPFIQELCQHLIGSGGKRLRPLLVLLSARACGYQGDQHISMAAAVEYFHTATLLHDDVVDESTLRRGKATANTQWGSKLCILGGDYLFTQSMEWIAASRDWGIVDLFIHAFKHISQGEIKQLHLRHNMTMTLSDYFDIIQSKTALLFSASAELGPRLTGQSTEVIQAMGRYGLHLGNAFQIIDDALDYVSQKEVMGKNTGDDLADGKVTLPLYFAIQHASLPQKAMIERSIHKGMRENLPDVLRIIEETGAMRYTLELADEEAKKAIDALSILGMSPYKQGLLDLVQFTLSRAL